MISNSVKFFCLSILLIILIFLVYNCDNCENTSERYTDLLSVLNNSVTKKFSALGTIYQSPSENFNVNFGLNVGEIIQKDVLDNVGLSSFSSTVLNKYLNFSSDLNVQNLSLGIYSDADLALSAISTNITYSGSIAMKLKMGVFSLNNITIFGINLGDFNLDNLEVDVFTKLTLQMSPALMGKVSNDLKISTKITFDKPQIVLPANLFQQFIDKVAPSLEYQFSCPDCGGYNCQHWYQFECWADYGWCEAKRQLCLGTDWGLRQAYLLTEKGILSLLFSEIPNMMCSLVNNGISSSLISKIINEIPAISSAIGTLFDSDPNIQSTVNTLMNTRYVANTVSLTGSGTIQPLTNLGYPSNTIIQIELMGGGGGGGSSMNAGFYGAAGGGGGSGTYGKYILPITSFSSPVNYSVGQGGQGGSPATLSGASSGGQTTFSTYSAAGGQAGNTGPVNTINGGNGGGSGGGSGGINGGNGSNGVNGGGGGGGGFNNNGISNGGNGGNGYITLTFLTNGPITTPINCMLGASYSYGACNDVNGACQWGINNYVEGSQTGTAPILSPSINGGSCASTNTQSCYLTCPNTITQAPWAIDPSQLGFGL